ncbi:MAG: T9SS type A sorting domain-containing protein [Bacteroidetes bacterium]|nr:MAG: hypothetical protein UZ10_BCD003000757 [Bacteroidetes bacterium OLB10]MCB8931058.1 T9SS type A sorting domain-containing protein [Bacteroidia bacterium]MCO5288125.1 T9SS type A sorting domain-containing protein [Bacteroidota bacterium]
MRFLKVYSILLIVLHCSEKIFSQGNGITNNWILGYGSYWGGSFGHTKFDFINGTPQITSDSLEMDINRTSANISDAAGNLLFYTNGYYIADATNDTMQNGNNISPTGFYNLAPKGLTVPQACLILRKPGSSSIYYMFHNTVDNGPQYNRAYYLYMSTIDMSLNNGLGAVTSKNVVMIQDTLNTGKITACKHANGRDWWVFCQRVNSNTYYRLLITPNVILGPYSQNIGNSRGVLPGGMTGFSPDGTKFAFFYAMYTSAGGLDVYDFNRCSGALSNPVHVYIPQTTGFGGGLAFSGNSRYLYTANVDWLYQFDMQSGNIAASQQTVAVWDSFYSPSPPFATLFDNMQLAPDGKIYVSTGNGTMHIHVINNPDSAGTACDVQQHSIQFQHYYVNGLPNHPNYFLDCDSTLGCLCASTVGEPELNPPQGNIKIFPNPNNGVFTLQFNVMSISGTLEIYDVMGRLVYKDYVAAWSQFKKVDVSNMPKGIYFCKIIRKEKSENVKVVKE